MKRRSKVSGGQIKGRRRTETKQLVHIADLRAYVASNPADKDALTFAKLSGSHIWSRPSKPPKVIL
jgi:hypothetical protein